MSSQDLPGNGTQRIALPMVFARHCAAMIDIAMKDMTLVFVSIVKSSRYKRSTDNLARKIVGPYRIAITMKFLNRCQYLKVYLLIVLRNMPHLD